MFPSYKLSVSQSIPFAPRTHPSTEDPEVEFLKERIKKNIEKLMLFEAQQPKTVINPSKNDPIVTPPQHNDITLEGTYEGETKMNKKNGYGIFKNTSGKEIYNGDWQNDLFDGVGILYNSTIDKLEEKWDYNNLNGIDKKWISYEGDFKNGKKHGLGILTLSNNEKFHGHFENEKAFGEGTFENSDGKIIVIGRWENNKLIKIL